MPTFLQVQNTVKAWLRDLPADTVAALPDLVQEAVREMEDRGPWRCMEASSTVLTVVANGNTLTTLVRFQGTRPTPRHVAATGGGFTPLAWTDTPAEIYGPGITGSPHYLHLASVNVDNTATVHVYPAPDGLGSWTGGEYQITVPFYQRTPALTSAASNWFTNNAAEPLRLLALKRAHAMNLDEERATYYEVMAAKELERVRAAERVSRMQTRTLSYRSGAVV